MDTINVGSLKLRNGANMDRFVNEYNEAWGLYAGSKSTNDYLSLVAALSNLLRVGAGSSFELVELQINTEQLSNFGWSNLLKFVTYSLKQGNADSGKGSAPSGKERFTIDNSVSVESFKREPVTVDIDARERMVSELLEEYGDGSLHASIDYWFVAPLAKDPELLTHFCEVYLK